MDSPSKLVIGYMAYLEVDGYQSLVSHSFWRTLAAVTSIARTG